MAEPESTSSTFPTYSSLTQTAAWADTAVTAIHGNSIEGDTERPGPRYVEGALLGAGGMGKVVLAHDERIGREIAVKELHATRTLSADERARFLREARVQGQLEHPSIVPVYDIDRRPDGTVFFTMRRVQGRTLHAILEDLRAGETVAVSRYTQRELLSAFATVCLAIDYAHSRGVIHRDLKPANIMLGDFGEVYVLDWGLAQLLGESAISNEPAPRLSMPGEVMGTPLYMAPEQLSDPNVGVAADVYTLGAILFELLTLVPLRDPRAPFVPHDARPSKRTPTRHIAPELEAICVTATQSEPEDRFGSTRALHQAVTRFLEGDRELEQRRELAAQHARAARAALTKAAAGDANHEVERGKAIRELTRALAFEPTNRDHLALLAELMATPPHALPPEIREQLRAESQQLVRLGTKASIFMVLSWLACVPVLAVLGIRDWSLLLYVAVPVTVSMIASVVSTRQRVIGSAIQYVAIGFVMLGAAGTSRLYGPVVLLPMLTATYAIVMQAHPSRNLRIAGAVAAAFAMTLPALLELAGVTASPYAFDGGRWTILPQLVELPRFGTIAFLAVAHLALIVAPCVFIARLRSDLSAAQRRQAIQAWHFRKLGDQLVEAS